MVRATNVVLFLLGFCGFHMDSTLSDAAHHAATTQTKHGNINRNRRNEMKVTKQQLLEWLGSDATKDTLVALLLEIANGEYDADTLRSDIFNTTETGEMK